MFFSFLRLSNFLSVSTIDNSRRLCLYDIIFAQDNAIIIVKWSKALPDRESLLLLFYVLGISPLFPITALRAYMASVRKGPKFPPFQVSRAPLLILLTDSAARKH